MTDVFINIFNNRLKKMPESIAQKIRETPYIKDLVLTSQKIVNKND